MFSADRGSNELPKGQILASRKRVFRIDTDFTSGPTRNPLPSSAALR